MTKSIEELELENERLNVFSKLSTDWFWEQDESFVFIDFSGQHLHRLYGIEHKLKGSKRWELDIKAIPPSDIEEHKLCCERHEEFIDFQYIVKDKDGNDQCVSVSGVPFFDDNGVFAGYRGVGTNITKLYNTKSALEKAKQHCKQLVDRNPIASFSIDNDHKVTHWNRSCELLSGINESDIIGCEAWKGFYASRRPVLADLVLDGAFDGAFEKHYGQNVRKSLLVPGAYEAEYYFPNLQQGCWLLFTATLLYDDEGIVNGAVEVLQDITHQKEQEKKIEHQANFDYLTGLPNRFLSLERINLLLEEARYYKNKFAVLFLDLDEFKKVNDILGHIIGDQLLVKCADRLSSIMRKNDVIGRMGGDEFVVVVKDCEHEEDVEYLANKIIKSFRKPFYIEGKRLLLTVSIGISVYPKDGYQAVDLISNSDVAMYFSKKEGRNIYHFFSPEMNSGFSQRLLIEEQLHGALARDELELYFQPIVSFSTKEIISAEALLRWSNPKLGTISPEDFIPVAEQTGLIIPIGYFVINEALRVLSEIKKIKGSIFNISINLSPVQFRETHLISKIDDGLNTFNVEGRNLTIEITEGVMLKEINDVNYYLDKFVERGIRLSMDDFGKGYSSLSYLRNYPFNTLKIDRSFVSDLNVGKSAPALIDATIAMSHALGLEVVAEGVETQYQFDYLSKRGCNYAQGYFISKPIPEAEFKKLIKQT